MAQAENELDLRAVARDAGPYPVEAFLFVREGLNHTVSKLHHAVEQLPESSRHVSGQQLCIGLRDFAIDRYGLLAPTVLRTWNIRRTDDFGRIVFAMIDRGLMSKTAEDTLEDFRAVFDFDEAFGHEVLERRVGRS